MFSSQLTFPRGLAFSVFFILLLLLQHVGHPFLFSFIMQSFNSLNFSSDAGGPEHAGADNGGGASPRSGSGTVELKSREECKRKQERFIAVFNPRRPIVDNEKFCPRCRSNANDQWWRIFNRDMSSGGHVLEAKNKGYCEVHAGDLNRELQDHFTADIRISAADWAGGASDQIYNQWWTQSNEDDAWHFSRKVQRGLDQSKVEVIYKETSGKNRVFGVRCRGCQCGILMRYRPGMSGPTCQALQFAFGCFLDERDLKTDPDEVAS